MKIKFLHLALTVTFIAGLASCDEKAKLADNVTGTWSTEQIELYNNAHGQAFGNDIFVFEKSAKDSHGGTVSIASTLSLTRAADALTPLDQPFSISIAATSSINGSWEAVDNDDIVIHFNTGSLAVTVDPDAVALVANPLSEMTQSEIDSIRPQTAAMYQMELTNAMRNHYSKYTKLDDVKLKDNGSTLKFEVGNKDFLLQKR